MNVIKKKKVSKLTESLFSDDDSDVNTNINNLNDIFKNTKPKNDVIFEPAFAGQLPDYYVYTDGACANNGMDNASAGFGIYFGENDPRNVSLKLSSNNKQTNNVAELYAVFHLYEIIKDDILNGIKIGIVTDSQYVIRCLTTYGQKLEKRHWIKNKEIPNKDLFKKTYELYKNKGNIKFIHVSAHTNLTDIHSIGNDRADKLANKAIGLDECPYTKIYLNVPFSKKEIIKQFGGKWSDTNKKWFILSNSPYKDEVLSQFASETMIK